MRLVTSDFCVAKGIRLVHSGDKQFTELFALRFVPLRYVSIFYDLMLLHYNIFIVFLQYIDGQIINFIHFE